jgi:hypothetical protein
MDCNRKWFRRNTLRHIRRRDTAMEKLRLSPEELRVDSFPIHEPAPGERGTVEAMVSMLPRTCPECAPTRGSLTC